MKHLACIHGDLTLLLHWSSLSYGTPTPTSTFSIGSSVHSSVKNSTTANELIPSVWSQLIIQNQNPLFLRPELSITMRDGHAQQAQHAYQRLLKRSDTPLRTLLLLATDRSP
jgi:hypothetical protein